MLESALLLLPLLLLPITLGMPTSLVSVCVHSVHRLCVRALTFVPLHALESASVGETSRDIMDRQRDRLDGCVIQGSRQNRQTENDYPMMEWLTIITK